MRLKVIHFELDITIELCYNISILGKDGNKMYYQVLFRTVDEEERNDEICFYLETFNEAVEFLNRMYETVARDYVRYRGIIQKVGD